ncbi:TonB-dependent receptor [Sphingomonas sp. SUN039]|uniref:TonB-dependent receptor n=1 Tax=Sphingomonas sp. SUN039 TaxID=2937787 RepID=UPI00216402C7|nr:TonB-dependent receptor [Sphingomonas sp. SUN039]UVO55514.1 TonB-dependent receptor [Sphingomonas sp. SUN039]
MKTIAHTKALLLAATAFATGATPALAQTAPAKPSDGVEEIVVTAQRRAENLQSVNIAATAISGDDLGERAVVRQLDLQNIAPGLSIVKAGLTEAVNIRGIGLASGSPNVSNGVASYLDGVFQPPIVSTGSFYDIAGIEVLRGPQGTLVGSNSTGGAIFINTNKPKLGKLEGAVNLEFGSYRHLGANGAINLPVGDNLAVRLSGLSTTRASYYNDIGAFANHPDRLSEQDIRGQILWQSGNFTAHYKAEFIQRETGGYAYQPIQTTGYSGSREPIRYQLQYNTTTQNSERAFINNLELRYETDGGLIIRALGAYQNKRIQNLYDTDGTSTFISNALAARGGQSQFVRERQTSGEINIISPTGGAFSYILGGYYQHNIINVRIFNFNTLTGTPSIWIEPDTDKTTTGLFAQANYKLSDQFEIQAGVRYSWFSVVGSGNTYTGRTSTFIGNPSPQTGEHQDGAFSGKLAINWTPNSDHLIYAFVARGYKPGGTNPPEPVGLDFLPEIVTDYEIGWKGSFFDRHLKTQIGGFYNKYSNFQQQVLNTASGRGGVANISAATIKGIEAQFQARFGGFSVDGGASYVNSQLGAGAFVNTRLVPGFNANGDLPQCATGVAPGATCRDYTPFIVQTTGGPALYAPEWTWNIGAQYTIPVGEGRLTPRLNYSFVGAQFTNLLYSPVTDRLESHGLVSGQISYESGSLRVEVYGTNLTNKYYVSGQNGNNEFYGAPREFGIRLGYRY